MRWLRSRPPDNTSAEADLRWHERGPRNPFGVRFLDCRAVTWNLISTTGDPQIAALYTALRGSDGRDLIEQPIEDAVRVATSLRLPHNGAALEGIVSKSDTMEVKWDIYIYDSVFLFARSWTGEMRYRAVASVGATEITMSEVECRRDEADLAVSAVYFLLATHAMGRVLPHQIPAEMATADPMAIAQWSFAQYGRLGCYATTADITSIPVTAGEP